MARSKQSPLVKQINKVAGAAKNVNGANKGTRLVTKRVKTKGSGTKAIAGKSQFGTRDQRYRDLRKAFGLSAG